MADQNRFSGLKELTVWKRQTDNYTITTQCGKCYSMGDHVAQREPPQRAALVCVTQCLALSRGATQVCHVIARVSSAWGSDKAFWWEKP